MASNWRGEELTKFKSAQYLSVPVSKQLIFKRFKGSDNEEGKYTAQSFEGVRGCLTRLFESTSKRVGSVEITFKLA